MVWRGFDITVSVPNYCKARWSKKLVLGHIINLFSHSLGRAVQENIWFSASVSALPTVGPILPASNQILSCTALPLVQQYTCIYISVFLYCKWRKAGQGIGMRLPNSYTSQTGLTPSSRFLLLWEQQHFVLIGHHVDRLHLWFGFPNLRIAPPKFMILQLKPIQNQDIFQWRRLHVWVYLVLTAITLYAYRPIEPLGRNIGTKARLKYLKIAEMFHTVGWNMESYQCKALLLWKSGNQHSCWQHTGSFLRLTSELLEYLR